MRAPAKFSGELIAVQETELSSAQARPSHGRSTLATLALLAAVFALACLPLILAPIVPTIDFYDHLSRYFVLSHIGGDPFLGENYASKWSLLPNIGLDVIGTILLRYVDVLAAGKIISLLIFTTQFTGVMFFSRMVTGRLSVTIALLATPLLYSFIFTWGFANFLLGLGLVFWGGGCWLAMRRNLLAATLTGSAFAIVIFLTHGVAFALYGLLLGGLELGFFLVDRRSLLELSKRQAALAIQAIVPAILFLKSATAGASDGVTNAGASIARLSSQGQLVPRLVELILYRIQTVIRVAEGPNFWFDLSTFSIIGAALIVLIRRGQVELPKFTWPALLIGVLLVITVPPAMFGVGYVSDRLPLFLALMFVGSLSVAPGDWAGRRIVVVGLTLIVVVRLAVTAFTWWSYGPDVAAFDKLASHIPPGNIVGYVSVSLKPRITDRRRCEMYGPLLVSRHHQASALFAIPTAQPMAIQGRLQRALSTLPEHQRTSAAGAAAFYRAELLTMIRERNFDYVLVCDLATVGRMPPVEGSVVDQAGRFTLLRIR